MAALRDAERQVLVPGAIAFGPNEQEYRPAAALPVGRQVGQLKWDVLPEDAVRSAHRASAPARWA